MSEQKRRIRINGSDYHTKEEVLSHVAAQLEFPDHFGMNYDALQDCLGDIGRPTALEFARGQGKQGQEAAEAGEAAEAVEMVCQIAAEVSEWNQQLNVRRVAEKIPLLDAPTPLHRLERISEDLGVEFYLKRDDLTSPGTGGNKLRKLEYFLKDALDQGATMLLTVGGAQTNHGRLTAAVAAKYGLKSAIAAVDPYPGEVSANLLLDGIMDCHVYLAQKQAGQDEGTLLKTVVERITKEWEGRGEKVYYIPMGGSNELGALGYYDCALEMAEQTLAAGLEDPHVFVTVGSMGTYIGLASAFANERLSMRLTGIGVLPYRDIRRSVAGYYDRVRQAWSLAKELSAEDFDVTSEYDCGGYNNPVKEVREAIYYMGRMEGIILDPCYTGKTFAAILRMVREGKIPRGEKVILIHTGGIPGIYTGHHRVEMEKELMDHIHICSIV